MSVDRSEVARLAGLARLDLDEGAQERMVDELNRVLEYAERLREVASEVGDATAADAEHEAGEAHAGMEGVRSPEVQAPDRLDRPPSALAPDWREGFFAVPPPPGVGTEEEGDGVDRPRSGQHGT